MDDDQNNLASFLTAEEESEFYDQSLAFETDILFWSYYPSLNKITKSIEALTKDGISGQCLAGSAEESVNRQFNWRLLFFAFDLLE